MYNLKKNFLTIEHTIDQAAIDNYCRSIIPILKLKELNADKAGIEWVKRQPDLVEKVRQWILLGYRKEENLFYYNFLCPTTGGHRIPLELPWERQCIICKKIWPSLVKWNYSCPCLHLEINPKEIILVAFIIASNLTVEDFKW